MAGEAPGFRRRILIEPSGDHVRAELEDDWHRMAVTLRHDGGIVTAVESEMPRRPWTTCPGAIDRLAETFVGVALVDAARRGEKTTNCTHLYDLAVFAAAHAVDTRTTSYDVQVCDPVRGARTARVVRDGVTMLEWTVAGDLILAPQALAGMPFGGVGPWIAALDPVRREAARILRWATILSYGRQLTIAAGSSGAPFASDACFTFQSDRAPTARRNPDADRDFSAGGGPLADRDSHFVC